LPILDTLMVIGIRRWRGKPLFAADRNHLHHQLLAIGLYHYEVVIVLYALQAICIGIAYQLRFSADGLVLGAYVLFCAVVLATLAVARLNNWKVHVPRDDNEHERRNLLLRRISWYHQNTARVIAPVLGAILLFATVQVASTGDLTSAAMGALLIIAIVWAALYRNMVAVTRTVCYLACPLAIYCLLLGDSTPQSLLPVDLAVGFLGILLALAIRITRKSQFHLDSQDYLILLIVAVAPVLLPESVQGATATRVVVYLAVFLYAAEYVTTKGNRPRWALSAIGALSIGAVTL